MGRRAAGFRFALQLSAALLTSCGDDDSSVDRESTDAGLHGDASVGGKGGRGSTGAGRGGIDAGGSAGRGGASGNRATAVECGATACQPPPSGFVAACCVDESTSTCGTRSASGQCIGPAAEVAGCPALNLLGILRLPSCCTSRGMCGIDATSVGVPGCLDLATAAERARSTGATVVFPAPRACMEDDAGAPDDPEADAG